MYATKWTSALLPEIWLNQEQPKIAIMEMYFHPKNTVYFGFLLFLAVQGSC